MGTTGGLNREEACREDMGEASPSDPNYMCGTWHMGYKPKTDYEVFI